MTRRNGQLLYKDGELVGSRIIGQPFSAPQYFHSRPSAAGNGYDAANSGGSNYAPTNKKLIDRVAGDVATLQVDHPGTDVPVDLVTASGSGLDPHITPAGAEFQVARVARERHMPEDTVRRLVQERTEGRQLGFLGEPRVNVLLLNLDLDRLGGAPRLPGGKVSPFNEIRVGRVCKIVITKGFIAKLASINNLAPAFGRGFWFFSHCFKYSGLDETNVPIRSSFVCEV